MLWLQNRDLYAIAVAVHANHNEGTCCSGVPLASSVSCIQLPDAIYVDHTVVVRVTTEVSGNTFVLQQVPEAISIARVFVEAVPDVVRSSIVCIGLRVGGLVAEDKDVVLVCGS